MLALFSPPPTAMKRLAMLALTCAALLPLTSQAASSRDSWVVNELYLWNHPLAATDSADLATKMEKMSASPFLFYRGTAHLFFRDMGTLPASSYVSSTTAHTWLQGDAHLGNFGAWKDSDGNYAFAVNDADEGELGQYVWDLRRFAVAIVLAARENGLSDSQISTAINTFVAAYVSQTASFAGNNSEQSFLLTKSNTTDVVDDLLDAAKADSRADFLDKYTAVSSGVRSFQTSPELTAVSASTYSAIKTAVAAYVSTIAASKQYAGSFYKVKDIRQKYGSGVGSLGKLRYWVLLEGASTSNADDVIIELKQETASAVSLAGGTLLPGSSYGSHQGNRVARTAKAQLLNADVLIGYASINGLPFYVHERSPYAEGFDYTALSSSSRFKTAMTYFGQALASAHALADQDYDSGAVAYDIDTAIKSADKTTGLQTELNSFAFDYADQVKLDWAAFVKAYQAGTALY